MFCVCTALLSKSYKIPVRAHIRTHTHSIRTSFTYAHFFSLLLDSTSYFFSCFAHVSLVKIRISFLSFFAKSKEILRMLVTHPSRSDATFNSITL